MSVQFTVMDKNDRARLQMVAGEIIGPMALFRYGQGRGHEGLRALRWIGVVTR